MDTKLSSNISKISEEVLKLQEHALQLERERDAWKERAEKAEMVLSWHNKFETVPKVIAAAEEAGLTPEEWIAQKLTEAVSPVVDLPVDPTVLKLFEEMARARGLSLREFTTGFHVTGVLKDLFANMVI